MDGYIAGAAWGYTPPLGISSSTHGISRVPYKNLKFPFTEDVSSWGRHFGDVCDSYVF